MRIDLTGYNPLQTMLDYVKSEDRTQEEIVSFAMTELDKAGIKPDSLREKSIVLELLAETFMEAFHRSNNVK